MKVHALKLIDMSERPTSGGARGTRRRFLKPAVVIGVVAVGVAWELWPQYDQSLNGMETSRSSVPTSLFRASDLARAIAMCSGNGRLSDDAIRAAIPYRPASGGPANAAVCVTTARNAAALNNVPASLRARPLVRENAATEVLYGAVATRDDPRMHDVVLQHDRLQQAPGAANVPNNHPNRKVSDVLFSTAMQFDYALAVAGLRSEMPKLFYGSRAFTPATVNPRAQAYVPASTSAVSLQISERGLSISGM